MRLWENDDLVPRPDDVFQERLFCVRWSETYIDDKGKERSLEILRYLSRLEHIPHLPHWKKDAEAAKVLAGAVENDHG